MKLVLVLSVLVGSLIFAGQLQAETIHTRLTRQKTSDHLYSFTVKVERLNDTEAGEFFKFHITVTTKNAGGHITQSERSGKLEVFSRKEFVASCDVQPSAHEGELSFTFQVAAKFAEKSRFTFAETPPRRQGGESGEGFFYWFYLQDFAESK